MILMLIVVIAAIAGGIATPFVVAQLKSDEPDTPPPVVEVDLDEEVEFIPFDEVTVNLDEARFSRYLRINFSLQVAKSQRIEIEEKVNAKAVIFKNWLQIHLAEKSTEDLRGKYGRNRIRREMQDFFNKVLFDDGIERIQEVLFDEFHVQ